MKNFKRLFAVAFVLCTMGFTAMMAQQMPPIPTDPDVRVGKLNNGLTYYIRKNKLPENKAFFYIAQKVGAIQEEPNQRGLAHFLEHMCFNGSKHFKGNSMISYLETIGVKFGANLNAYTSVDETVYNIDNVPVTTKGAIDSCLLILHDWSHDLALDPKEIDNERGVIQGEWRMRRSAMQRMNEQMIPVMMKGSKYEDCLPIGNMDVVMHFKPQTLRNYYEKWYRPDLQAIVVVGDINPDEIEAKIKTVFADIKAVENPAKRVYYKSSANKEPIVFIGKDKELQYLITLMFFKHDAVPDSMKTNLEYLMRDYACDMISQMLNARYEEMMQQESCPFAQASVDEGNFFVDKSTDAVQGQILLKEDKIDDGIAAFYREVLRAKQFGFTATEYGRARAELLRQYESQYNERDKQESSKFVNKYVRNFLDNEPIPSIEQRYQLMNQIAPNIPVEAINQMIPELVTDSNLVIAYLSPEKEGLKVPAKEELLDVVNKVKGEKLEAYVDKVSNEPLIKNKPASGSIKSVKENQKDGTTEILLSNGAKVIVKKTDFKKDEINMSAMSKGGYSLYKGNDILNAKMAGLVTEIGGLGNFNTIDLQKMLSGKIASVEPSVSINKESLSAECSPKDFETMMQMVYLAFTAPHKDEKAAASMLARLKDILRNSELNPQTALADTVAKAKYFASPYQKRMTMADLNKVNYDDMLRIYKERFSNAADFTFYFVGNVDMDSLKAYAAQYIASLPASGNKEKAGNVYSIRKGVYTNDFTKEMQTPASNINVSLTAYQKYNHKNSIIASVYGQLLMAYYLKTIREQASLSYAPQASANLEDYPVAYAHIDIKVPAAPEKKDSVILLIKQGLEFMTKNGPEQNELDKVKAYMLKRHQDKLKENNYWMAVLAEKWETGMDAVSDYDAIINNLTVKDIQKYAADVAKQNNVVTVIMSSKK
jgi:zinc protease